MKKPELRIPTMLGLVIAVVGLAAGLLGIKNPITWETRATPEETPREVQITNISDAGFTASWVTDRATTGFVRIKEERLGAFERVFSDNRDQEQGVVANYFTHLVTVGGLNPAKKYLLRLGSGRSTGGPIVVKTAATRTILPAADIAFGQVVTTSGDPAAGAIVYAQIPGAVAQATLVRSSGSWVIPLSLTRKMDLSGFLQYDRERTPIKFLVQGGVLGKAQITTTTGNDSPVSVLAVGQSIAPSPTAGPGLALVTITSPKDKEVWTQEDLVIAGLAPAGAEITLNLNNKLMGKTISDGSGAWKVVVTNVVAGEQTASAVVIWQNKAFLVGRSFSVLLTE